MSAPGLRRRKNVRGRRRPAIVSPPHALAVWWRNFAMYRRSWTLNILPQFFLEPMFGAAVHDGNATATPVPDENTLGCRVLFHTGLSGGYRLTEQWTALLTWDHISNAHLCAHNAGMNNAGMNDYGVKIGYSF